MSSAAPAPRSLRGALDALRAGDAEALVQLQADLLDAQASRLIRIAPGSDEPENRLARRAVREGRTLVERHDDVLDVVAPLGRDGDVSLVAAHRLARATPLAMALAEERLELTTALFRARSGDGGSDWAAVARLAQAFATADTATAAWCEAALIVRDLADARRAIVARVEEGRVTLVADSAGPAPSSDLLSALKLAAGEVLDFGGHLEPGQPLPLALRTLAAGEAVHARVGHAGSRAAILIAFGAASPDALPQIASVLAALRPPRFQLLPAWLVDKVASLMPDGADRRRRARRAIWAMPLILLLVPVPMTVVAPVTVQALDQRLVTAPFDGRIEAVLAEPGDQVTGGRTVLARLDARAAVSERADVLAGLQAALSQAGVARTEGRVDEARQAQLQAQQLSARAQALGLQIASAEIRAPIDGILGGDDLRRRVGSPVSRGETLFAVAKPGRYRAEVRVSDRDIDRIEPKQRLSLALRARVLSRPMATVTRVYPIAEISDGDNIFRVIATIDADDKRGLLPGMEGRASVRTGWAPLGWAIAKGPVRWLRQTLWI